jgi:NADH-quinone oxidoreductase subunit M
MLKRHSRPVIRDELRRSYTLYLFAGSLPLFLAASRIGFYGRHVNPDSPFDLAHLTAHPLPIAAQPLVLGLVLVPVLVRMGVFPLHSWMPLHIEHCPLGIGVMTLGTNLGVYVLARTVPVVPDAAQDWMPHLAYLALGSGLFGSTLAVVQTNLRRAVGFLVVSQSSLMLLGLASMTGPGVHGALLQALASGGALGGLLILVWALEARTGTSDYRHFGGFARSMPRMATVFFVFSAASVGFPGTLMFISEDLIIQGIVEQAPAVTAAVLFAMAANGYVLFRAFSRTFLGASDEVADVLDPNFTVEDSGRDLLPRERLVAVGFAAVVVLAGLWPQPLLTLTEPAVYPIARHDPGPTDAHHAAASPPAPRSDAPQATAHN